MQNVLPKLVTAGVLALLALSFLGATPALAACAPGAVHCLPPPYSQAAAPVWATLNAVAGGNYPGGNEEFDVFVVNSDSPPLGNATLLSETLTTPFQNVSVSGLPVELASGQSLSSNITVQIPRDFAQNNFTASILIHLNVANSTVASAPTELTGSAQVVMLGFPLEGVNSTSPTSAGKTTTTTPSAPQPVWATLNALAYGNYPGGNEEFDVFVVNSDSPPLGNASLINETLTAPALPPSYNTGYAIGLPVQLSTGQAILSTIYLEIPANFTQSNFTAAVVINMQIANGTGFFSRQLTVSTTVVMLALPGTITTQSSTTSMVSSSQTTAQTSGISSSLFYGGIAIASAIVIILTALLARRRARPS